MALLGSLDRRSGVLRGFASAPGENLAARYCIGTIAPGTRNLTVSTPGLVRMEHISRNSRIVGNLLATAMVVLCGNAAMAMTLNSPVFKQNGHIPSKYTCEGEDVSPPLAWEGVPTMLKVSS